MNTVDWLRKFRNMILNRTDQQTSWGRNMLREEIDKIYQALLEEMINQEEK